MVRRLCCGIGLVALLLGGCTNTAEKMLNALRADDMASVQWEGIDEVGVLESDPHVIKPGQPYYTRCLATAMPIPEAQELILASAEDFGWQPQENLITDTSWAAHRVVDGTTRTLILSTELASCADEEGAVLHLTLTYQ